MQVGGLQLRHQTSFRWPLLRSLCLAILACGALLISLKAQDAAPSPSPPISTLHVYSNQIQVPVLVLNRYREALGPVAPEKFAVSIDSGPPVSPTHVRLEGSDPISLAILLDAGGDEALLLPKMADAIAQLAPLSLTPRDHVSIYALDCTLSRTASDLSADSALLKQRVDTALAAWTTRHGGKADPSCKSSFYLRDALMYMTQELSHLPGRRVVLATTSGEDGGSRYSWRELRNFAQESRVTIFGLSVIAEKFDGYGRDREEFRRWKRAEPSLNLLCELTGGIGLTTDRAVLSQRLKWLMRMVRERYIVEFPRSNSMTPGPHSILVTIAGSEAMIRPAGVVVPVADAHSLRDPMTLPSDQSHAPQPGTRRVLPPPQ